MQEWISNVMREMKNLEKSIKELLETKNKLTKIKSAFDGLISRFNASKEKASEMKKILNF